MEHAWKACIRDKRIVGSNPTSSECNEEEATQQFVLRGGFEAKCAVAHRTPGGESHLRVGQQFVLRGSKSRDEIMLPP